MRGEGGPGFLCGVGVISPAFPGTSARLRGGERLAEGSEAGKGSQAGSERAGWLSLSSLSPHRCAAPPSWQGGGLTGHGRKEGAQIPPLALPPSQGLWEKQQGQGCRPPAIITCPGTLGGQWLL